MRNIVHTSNINRGDMSGCTTVDSVAQQPLDIHLAAFVGCFYPVQVVGNTVINQTSFHIRLFAFIENRKIRFIAGNDCFFRSDKAHTETLQHGVNTIESSCGNASCDNKILSFGTENPLLLIRLGAVYAVCFGKCGIAQINGTFSFGGKL